MFSITAMASAAGPYRRSLRCRLATSGSGRIGFAIREVPRDAAAVLDIGCGQGWVLGELPATARRVGIDTDVALIAIGCAERPDCDLRAINGTELPFADAEFDAVLLGDVIEHVGQANKQQVIDEALRVLKDDGRLILTAPHAGLLAFLDPLDYKRRFPEIYRLFERRRGHGPSTPHDVGHQHVDLAEITDLIGGHAELTRVEYSGATFFCDLLIGLVIVLRLFIPLPIAIDRPLGIGAACESSIPAPRFLALHMRLVARRVNRSSATRAVASRRSRR